jgi:hypothetical protein
VTCINLAVSRLMNFSWFGSQRFFESGSRKTLGLPCSSVVCAAKFTFNFWLVAIFGYHSKSIILRVKSSCLRA